MFLGSRFLASSSAVCCTLGVCLLPANTLLHGFYCCCTQILRYPSPDFVPVTNTHQATTGPFTGLPYDTSPTMKTKAKGAKRALLSTQLLELHGLAGLLICCSTLSSHCSGPCRCISIQHGVERTFFRLYSMPQPFTKDMRMVHIRARAYTASKPWLTR